MRERATKITNDREKFGFEQGIQQERSRILQFIEPKITELKTKTSERDEPRWSVKGAIAALSDLATAIKEETH